MFGKKIGLNKLAIGLLFLMFLSLNLKAQNIQFSQGKVEEGMSNSLGIPLGSYKGRGVDLPVTLNYSSNVWRIDNINTVLNNDFSAYQTMTQVIYSEYSTSGWKSSLDLPTIEYPKVTDTYYNTGKTYCYPCNSGASKYRVAKVTIHMPDGSSHELRKSDTRYADWGSVDKTGTFYAVDGSRMRFDSTGDNSGTLYLPDGTRYILEHPYSYIVDKNGNTLTYNENNRQWTDTLGRTIANPLPANPQAGDFTYNLPGLSGVNNGLQAYTFKWRNLADALTPDANNNTPDLRVMASHYLPYNSQNPNNPPQDPTAPSGNNYPQEQSSQYQSLFYSDYGGEDGPLTMVVGKGQIAGQLFNPVVLTEVVMPNGMKYKFSYNIYGEIDKIVYPTGAYEKYQMQQIAGSWNLSVPYGQANRGVTSRKLSENGTGNDILEWKYSKGEVGFGSWGTGVEGADVYKVIAPDKTRTEVYKIKLEAPWHGQTDHQTQYWSFDYINPLNGATVEKRVFSSSTDGLGGQLLRRELTEYASSSTGSPAAYRNIRPVKNVSIIFEGSGSALAQTTTLGYDTTNQWTTGVDQNSTSAYHYAVLSNQTAQTATIGNISNGTLANKAETVFLNDTNYQSRNILGLPTSIVIKDASLNTVSKVESVYDEYDLDSPGTPYQWQDPQSSVRGNVTTVRSYKDLANNQYIETHSHFDKFGNSTSATDGRNNTTTTGYSATYNYAYPTSVTTPVPDANGTNGSNHAFTTSTVYDYMTGLSLSVTDANNQTAQMQYNDVMLRLTKTIAPNGQQTITEYGAPDAKGQLPASQRFVKVKTQIDTEKWKEGKTWFDGLGRTIKAQSVDSSGDVFTETEYDNMGRAKKVTNPYRTGETVYKTESFYDDLGRVTKIKTPDNAEVNTSYLLATAGNNTGTAVLVTDQAGKQRRSITNALGQLTRVDEPDVTNSDQLGAIDAPNQATYYEYDALNNLTKVKQGGTIANPTQTRTFVYDSLSRLKSATNPESGIINFTYDNNGNLATKIDVQSITTTYTYDALNRVTLRDYSDSTPDVSYVYDNLTNAKGELVKVENSVSRTEYQSFDIMGSVLQSQQFVDGAAYPAMTYTYNLSGALIEQKYPSGRVVKNVLDTDGDLSIVQSKKNQIAGFWNYADNFNYTAAGAIKSMQLGNGRWESTVFNSRLQPTQIALGTVQNGTDKLKLNFDYGTMANNGNVLSQTITVPTVGATAGFMAIQTYTYDALNRLKSATENKDGNTTPEWKQTFDYDRFGNRTFNEAGTTASANFPKTCGTSPNLTMCAAVKNIYNPQAQTADNKFSTSDGYQYDAVGNTTRDAQNRKFTYDAENKQTKVETVNSNGDVTATLGEYYYDGDGKRVKKYVPGTGETTVFIYDASGKLVAENSTLPAPTHIVSYLTNDHLGSPRINTDQNGNVTARHDYQPFGEEIQRASYGADTNRKQFTGYERDKETDLDFAQSRYFDTGYGRFSSPDSFMNDTHVSNPQSWNLYSYVRNNPLNTIDPLGKKGKISWYLDDNGVVQVTLKASFAIYGAEGQNVNKEDLEAAKKLFLEGAKKLLTKKFDIDGIKFNVSVNIKAKVYESEEKAIKSGKDNIVELGYDDLTTDEPGTVGVAFGVKGEKFDRMAVQINEDFNKGNTFGTENSKSYGGTFAHEFAAHLLSGYHNLKQSESLFYGNDGGSEFTDKDFIRLFRGTPIDTLIPPPPGEKSRNIFYETNLKKGSSDRLANSRNNDSPSAVYKWKSRVGN